MFFWNICVIFIIWSFSRENVNFNDYKLIIKVINHLMEKKKRNLYIQIVLYYLNVFLIVFGHILVK